MRMFVVRMLMLLAVIVPFSVSAQVFLYFQDSESSDFYDASWMELTSPSELERKGTDLRRFPVETTVTPQQGVNSLRLKWRSLTGGNWLAIAAGTDWTANDLTGTDTCMFYLRSLGGLSKTLLPKIFMEDVNNAKTTFHDFSAWTQSLPNGVWTRITIPMSVFFNAGDPVDFSRIKTIGFAQNNADGQEHVLYIDNMKVFKGSGVNPPASAPTGVIARGFDSHAEIRWNKNPETWVTGYQVEVSSDGGTVFLTAGQTTASDTLLIDWTGEARGNYKYRVRALNISNDLSAPSEVVEATTRIFTDEELLSMVQEYTFRYFWDFAHPVSGMARERNTSGDVVTSGGSGFGIMAVLTGINREFITREAGIGRLEKIVGFLETADRFHGAWPHWLNGQTGRVVPFSTYDNGGDLVETAFLMEGLLTARQFLDESNTAELDLKNRITALWEGVEWDWYSRNSQTLYWHWSPDYGWQINMKITGWNEAAIVYVLAVASPTHPVPASAWDQGWAGNSTYSNGRTFYGYKLDVGWDYGGPLFFAHYSFMGLDPRGKKDKFANYFVNNRNHTLINRAYCIDNPGNYQGYAQNVWGLTASDDPDGYAVHEPVGQRDNGTITPSAALSSMPYTPDESIGALKGIYRGMGEKNWGPMGFFDAFNVSRNWYADSYLAIDQGPVICMIENYRSGLLWSLFMSNPEIDPALDTIGFVPDASGVDSPETTNMIEVVPNPAGEQAYLRIIHPGFNPVSWTLLDLGGRHVSDGQLFPAEGRNIFRLNFSGLSTGFYLLRVVTDTGQTFSTRLVISR